MNIIFECPVCCRRYEVPPQQAGTEMLCPGCNSRMVVPNYATTAAPTPDDDSTQPPAPPEPDASLKQSLLRTVIAGTAMGLLLGVVLFLYVGRQAGPSDTKLPKLGRSSSDQTRPLARSLPRFGETARPPTANKTLAPPDSNTTVEISEAREATTFASTPVTSSRRVVTSAGLPITVGSHETVTFGPSDCPVAVLGNSVWNIQTRKVQATLQSAYEDRALTSLSSDGQYFAATRMAKDERNNPVVVSSAATGETVFVVPGDGTAETTLVKLAGTCLFVAYQSSEVMRRWNVADGEEESSLEMPNAHLENKNTAVTSDGRYVATVADGNKIVVISIDTGETVARMRPPKKLENAIPDLPPGMVRVDRGGWIVEDTSGKATADDRKFIYSGLQALEFSPASRHLAAISTNPKPHVIAWNDKGTRLLDERLYGMRNAFCAHPLTWFPGEKAFLIERDVFDRESGKIVVAIHNPLAEERKLHVHDDDHLVGTFTDRSDEIEVREIPWSDIRKSLAQFDEKGPALLGPAEPVSIVFELGPLSGDQNRAVQQLGGALKARLERNGLNVQEGRQTFFRMRLSKSAGDSLPIHERQLPFEWRERHAGRRATGAEGQLVVELMVPGNDEPIWRDSLSASSSRSFDDLINDTTVRNSMIENLSRQLEDLTFPYFIPESKELLALPVILQ